jgi:hypothetical protein
MTYRAIIAHEDALRLPETRMFQVPANLSGCYLGGPHNPASGLLSDDLGEGTIIYTGQSNLTVRWEFLRRATINVVAVMNVRYPTTVPTQNSATTIVALLKNGTTTVGSQSLVFTQRPTSPLDIDRFWIPSSPLEATALEIQITGPTVGLAIGRVFAGMGLTFTGGTEGGLDEGWSLTMEDAGAAPLSITGAAKPQPSATGRLLRFALSGISDAAAITTPAAASYGALIERPAYGLTDFQLRAAQARPVLALVRANAADPTRYRYAAFGPLIEPLVLSRPAGHPTWTASFAIREVNR